MTPLEEWHEAHAPEFAARRAADHAARMRRAKGCALVLATIGGLLLTLLIIACVIVEVFGDMLP